MAASTPKGITYPTSTDGVSNLKSVFSTMASSIDDALDGYIKTSDRATLSDVTPGTSSTKVVTAKALADAGFIGGDTGWVDISSSVTAGSGFAKMSDFAVWVRKVGPTVQISVHRLQKTSTNPLPIPTHGNITNRVLVSGIPAAYRPSFRSTLGSDASGRMNHYIAWPDGTIQVASMMPTSTQTGTVNCPVGEQFSCAGVYFA